MAGPLKLSRTPLLEKSGIALFNSASPWASSQHDLQALYESPHTALVTTRTAVVTTADGEGGRWQSKFEEDSSVHGHAFLRDLLPTIEGGRLNIARGSLNSYGYSPNTLDQYLEWIEAIWHGEQDRGSWKPFMISLTGPADAAESATKHIRQWTAKTTGEREGTSSLVAIELNLSCPNIKGHDMPSGYDAEAITGYIVASKRANTASIDAPKIAVALKVPPYTFPAQFALLIKALESVDIGSQDPHPITFLTSVNTLGGSFWLNPGRTSSKLIKALPTSLSESDGDPHMAFDGTGGLAGESLHPLALGNVYTLRNLLRSSADLRLKHILVLGVGGVMSGLSAIRMKEAGASAVGLATALGREGVSVFERISNEIMLLSESDEGEGNSLT